MNFSASNNVPWSTNLSLGGTAALLGASLHMQLRANPGATSVALDLSTANGDLAIIDTVNRIATIHVPGPAMLAVPAGAYFYDVVVTPAAGDPFIGNSGTVTISQGITLG